MPPAIHVSFRVVASATIVAERSIETIFSPTTFSRTTETATPWPQPISNKRSSGRCGQRLYGPFEAW